MMHMCGFPFSELMSVNNHPTKVKVKGPSAMRNKRPHKSVIITVAIFLEPDCITWGAVTTFCH